MHEDHRKRIKQRFLKDGIENMADHEVLELLLFYSIPRKDTNPLAHSLIERFGSLNKVLEAKPEELMQVDGIAEASVCLITLAFQLAKRYIRDASKDNTKYYTGKESVEALLKSKFLGSKEENVYMISLDAAGRILNMNKIAQGGFTSASFDRRLVLEIAFRNKASAIVLVHNHLNGIGTPSRDDVEATKSIISAFFGLGVNLVDHLIYTDTEIIAMSQIKKLAPLFL